MPLTLWRPWADNKTCATAGGMDNRRHQPPRPFGRKNANAKRNLSGKKAPKCRFFREEIAFCPALLGGELRLRARTARNELHRRGCRRGGPGGVEPFTRTDGTTTK